MLATLHALSSAAQEKVLVLINERLENKDLTEGLSLNEICRLLQSLGVNIGILFDKLRLETGQSTSNVGIAGLITHAHRNGVFDEKTGEFKASLTGGIEKKASTEPDALVSQNDNVENAVQVVENKGERERDVG